MAFWDALRAAVPRPTSAAGQGFGDWLQRQDRSGFPGSPGILPQPWENASPPWTGSAQQGQQPALSGQMGMSPADWTQAMHMQGQLGQMSTPWPQQGPFKGMTPEMMQQAMFAPRPTMATSRFPQTGGGSAYGPVGSMAKSLAGGIKF